MLMRSCEGIIGAIERVTHGVLLFNYNVKLVGFILKKNTLFLCLSYFMIRGDKFDRLALKWLLLSKYNLYEAILFDESTPNLLDLDNPFNCLSFQKNKSSKRRFINFIKFFTNILKLIFTLCRFKGNIYFIYRFRKKIAPSDGFFKSFLRTVLYVYNMQKFFQNGAEKSRHLKLIDNLNFGLNQRCMIAREFAKKKITPAIHGGGYFIYEFSDFDTFPWQSSEIIFREELMCAFPKPNELLTMCHGSKSITVGLGAYWFKTDGGQIFGQNFLSEQEQINLIQSLCLWYKSENILVRDPTKLISHFKKQQLTNCRVDLGDKDQIFFTSGSIWPNEFVQTDLKIVTAFFTLGLQLLLSNQPAIIFVTNKSLYPRLYEPAKRLVELGVFVQNKEDIIRFNDVAHLQSWWHGTLEARRLFLCSYIENIEKTSGRRVIGSKSNLGSVALINNLFG